MNKIRKIKKCSVLQHDTSDCGVACLVSVIRYLGGDVTLEKVRRLSGTGRTGTTMLGLYQAASQCGIDPEGYEATVEEITAFEHILILHVTPHEGLDHYVVDFGCEDDRFIIWDPATGLRLMTGDEVKNIWKSRKCLGLVPNDSFVGSEGTGRKMFRWIKEIIRPDLNLLLTSIVIGIGYSVLGLVMALFSQKLVDVILPAGDTGILTISLLLVLVLLIARQVLGAVRQQILLYQGKFFNIRIIENFFGSILYLPKSFFDGRKTGDFVGRLNDTLRIQRVISELVSIYIIDVMVLIVTLIALLFYSVTVGLLTLSCLPLFFLIVYRRNKKIITAQHDVMSGYALSESNYIDSIQGISEIKSMNWQPEYRKRNNTIYINFQEKVFNLGAIRIRLELFTGIPGTFYLITVLFYSSVLVIRDRMTTGELLAILSLSSAILPAILDLALVSVPFQEAKVAISRMFEFSMVDSEEESPGSSTGNLEIQSLRLEDISYRFPGQRLLLDKVFMEIEKKKVISLVGESGCGKSTLANIILRFYPPGSGVMTVNGNIDSNEIDLKGWRSRVAIIPQEIHVFNGTILQNIISEYTENSYNKVISTISGSGLNSFIECFPAGLNTMIGEDGINLSGGQKQLLAFIRVLIREPDILVIDEATSNMDRNTECLIRDLISKLRVKTGILLITHRINMIRELSDYIYIIDGKSVDDHGTHDDLMSRDNLYRRFWNDYG